MDNYSQSPTPTYSDDTAYQSPKHSRFSLKSLIAVGVLAGFAAIAVVSGLLLKQSSSLDDRSKASLSGNSYQAISERFDANGDQAFDVYLVNSQQPETTKYTSFTTEIMVSPLTKGQVLGMSTQDESNLIAATDPNVRFPIYSPTPKPAGPVVVNSCNQACTTNDQCGSGYTCVGYVKPTPCPPGIACAAMIPRPGACRNQSCTTSGSCVCPTPTPTYPSCNKTCTTDSQCGSGLKCIGYIPAPVCPPGAACPMMAARPGSCRNPACSSDQACGCASATPTPTIGPDATLQLARDGKLYVYTLFGVNDIFTFSAPTIARTADGSGYKVTVTGKVKKPQDQAVIRLLRSKYKVFTIAYKGPAANVKFAGTKLTWQSIKGLLPVAPNLETELTLGYTAPPTPSATPLVSSCNRICYTSDQCGTGFTCTHTTTVAGCITGKEPACAQDRANGPGVCRAIGCTSEATCVCPTPTSTPKPTPIAMSVCNATCVTDGQCGGGSRICLSGQCRNKYCQTSATCGCEGTPSPSTKPTPTPSVPLSCGQPCGAQADGTVFPANCTKGTICGNGSNGGTSGNRCLPLNAPGYITSGGSCAKDPNPAVYCINKTDGTRVLTAAEIQTACGLQATP